MIKVDQVLTYLNTLLKPREFRDYGPNGLQVEGKANIKKVSFSVSATIESIEKSIEWGSDCLITHHGLIWGYQSNKTITGAHYKRLKGLIKHGINLISYHLPLDGHIEFGNAAQLAKVIGLENLIPFGEYKGNFTGVKGEFKEPLSVEKVSELLKSKVNPQITHAQSGKKNISSIGIITGGANNEWVQAQKHNLDAYITGEISEYNWHDSIEAGVDYFACGHHATERFGVLALEKLIKENFSGVDTVFFDSDNPV